MDLRVRARSAAPSARGRGVGGGAARGEEGAGALALGAVVAVVAVLAVETAETGRGWTRAGDAAIAARPGLANRRTAGGRRGQWRRGRRRAVWALETLHALDAEVGNVAGGRGLARCKRGRAARLVLGGIGQPRCRPEGSRAGAGAGREVWQAAVWSMTVSAERWRWRRRRWWRLVAGPRAWRAHRWAGDVPRPRAAMQRQYVYYLRCIIYIYVLVRSGWTRRPAGRRLASTARPSRVGRCTEAGRGEAAICIPALHIYIIYW